ncbi:MAG: GYF domain-containing protein [Chthoniobacterales bacterium]
MHVQHTYRIRHRGIESTPFTLRDLRQMWQAGQIDASTEFRRGDSEVWLDANDLLPELEFSGDDSGKTTATPDPATLRGPEFSRLTPIAPQSVRLTSVRVPFREILVLVLKFYLAALLIALAIAALWVLLGYLLR